LLSKTLEKSSHLMDLLTAFSLRALWYAHNFL